MTEPFTWPQKTGELHNHHFDSTKWNGFQFRDDDIVIATCIKSGTTLCQQIVAQLLFQGEAGLPVADMSPWVDLRVPGKETTVALLEAQTHRRFMKTHLPMWALNFSPRAKYIYIGRDGRDVVMSMHNHHSQANDLWYQTLNETPGLVGDPIERPTESIADYFHEWLMHDGHPFWPFWDNIRSWWEWYHLPNILFLHFEQLVTDRPNQIRRIARFLDIPIDESRWDAIVEHTSFGYMKRNATASVPLAGAFWNRGAGAFIHQGRNGRWRNVLRTRDVRLYQEKAVEELGLQCANWLATGDM